MKDKVESFIAMLRLALEADLKDHVREIKVSKEFMRGLKFHMSLKNELYSRSNPEDLKHIEQMEFVTCYGFKIVEESP